jgi:hypothetical protein
MEELHHRDGAMLADEVGGLLDNLEMRPLQGGEIEAFTSTFGITVVDGRFTDTDRSLVNRKWP